MSMFNYHSEMARLIEMADLVRPMAVRAAASLRIVDHISQGARSIGELARASGAAVRPLTALVGLLGEMEIVGSAQDGRLELTRLGEAMSSAAGPLALILDTEGPLGRYDIAVTGLTETVRTGRAAFETQNGGTYWEFVAGSAELSSALAELQSPLPVLEPELIVSSVDWREARAVLDVGGSNGALLVSLLNTHPHLTGAVLDLPGLRANALEVFKLGDETRLGYMSGDFFDVIPERFDTYILSAVLYDWDDARAVQLLRRLAEVPTHPRVLISEISMQSPGEQRDHRLDLQMFCGAAGFERTPKEVVRLGQAAGLEPVGDVLVGAQRFVVEMRSATS